MHSALKSKLELFAPGKQQFPHFYLPPNTIIDGHHIIIKFDQTATLYVFLAPFTIIWHTRV